MLLALGLLWVSWKSESAIMSSAPVRIWQRPPARPSLPLLRSSFARARKRRRRCAPASMLPGFSSVGEGGKGNVSRWVRSFVGSCLAPDGVEREPGVVPPSIAGLALYVCSPVEAPFLG